MEPQRKDAGGDGEEPLSISRAPLLRSRRKDPPITSFKKTGSAQSEAKCSGEQALPLFPCIRVCFQNVETPPPLNNNREHVQKNHTGATGECPGLGGNMAADAKLFLSAL